VEKDRNTKASDDPRTLKAREELQIASDRYYRSPTENNKEEVELTQPLSQMLSLHSSIYRETETNKITIIF